MTPIEIFRFAAASSRGFPSVNLTYFQHFCELVRHVVDFPSKSVDFFVFSGQLVLVDNVQVFYFGVLLQNSQFLPLQLRLQFLDVDVQFVDCCSILVAHFL